MAKQQHDLVALVHLIQDLVNALPRYDWQRPEPYRRAEQAIIDRLRDKGARITRGTETTISLAGVRSGSTGGDTAALKNWIGAARRRLDQQALAKMGGRS